MPDDPVTLAVMQKEANPVQILHILTIGEIKSNTSAGTSKLALEVRVRKRQA